MTSRGRSWWALVAAAALLAGAGCVGETTGHPGDVPIPVPNVAALSTTAAAVGDEIFVMGGGFIDPSLGRTEITFDGEYHYDNGFVERRVFSIELEHVDEGTLRWSRFGPYQIPFARSGNQLGSFVGQVYATNYAHDGREARQVQSTELPGFQVLPSLVVREVTAHGEDWESDCTVVSTRLINYIPYRLTVEAVGFEAERFVYTVSAGALNGGVPATEPTVVEHVSEWGPTILDSLGEIESFRFAEVPMGVPVYRASVAVQAITAEGQAYEQFLMLTIHQPLYVRSISPPEPAELMAPVPVSGCIPGGVNGRDVTYSETTTETRTVSSAQTYSANWTKTYTESHTDTYGESGSESNKIGFSSADQANWQWNIHGDVMVGGEAGVPLVTKGKVELRVGGGREWGGYHTDTRSGEQQWVNTTSYQEAVTTTDQLAESMGEAFTETWTVTTATSEALNFRTFLLPNHFGVFYRQTTRLVSRGQIIAMDLCGNETVVGEIILNDYTWAPDLAMSTAECPPFPESQLPEAQCIIPPCDPQY